MLNRSYIRIIFFFFFVCYFSGTSLSAQEYLVKSFGAKQGLASAEIYTMFQDDDGYLWLGTRLGVSKFDGISFVNYNGSSDLRFGKVSAITQDANRTIWVGCENGLFFFEEGVFKQVAFDSRFPDSWIYALNAEEDNRLWIGTSDGPVLINAQQLQKIKSGDTLAFKILSNWAELSDPSNQVFSITSVKRNNEYITYFGTRNSVIEFKNNVFAIKWFSREPRLEDVSAIKITNKNKLLIGNKSGFYYRENENGFDTIHDFTYATGMTTINDSVFYVLGFEGVYSITGNTTQKLTEIASLGYDSPSCILYDKEQNLWIGTWEGLVQLRKNTITTWLPGKTPNLNDMFSVTESPSGEMVFGGNRGNVIVFENNQFNKYFGLGQQPWPLSEVFGLYFSNNLVWMGSGYQGLSVWDGKNMFNYAGEKLRDEHAQGFFRDEKNNLFVLSDGGLTQVKNPDNPSALEFDYFPWKIAIGGQFLKIFDYAVLKDNAIYLATNFGVVYFNGDTLLQVTTDNALLNDALITSFALQDNQTIWLATGNYGLFKIQPDKTKAKVLEHLSETEGLLANATLDLVADEKRNYLWCAHYNGLTVIDLNKKNPEVVKRIIKDEGFLPYDFTYCKLAIQQQTDCIWIATTAGVQRLNINEMPRNRVLATPIIRNVLLFNNADAVGEYAKGKGKVNGLWVDPKFPHNKNAISFNFQSLSLVIPELNRCRYKLIGYNEEWVYTKNEGEVTFAALSPGNYTFVLEAANNDGLWNATPASYSFTITKPYWATWWFILLAVLTVMLISYGIYRYRINQLIKIGNIRNKIAGDLHDDIGSTLSSISMYSEIVRNQISDKTDVNDELLKKITQNSKEMVDNMSDIVWAIKPENDHFKNIESRMFNFATEMCNLKGVELKMDKSNIDGDIKIRMEERRDFYLLFKEAVNNAIKYAQCSTLMVNFSIEQKTLVMTIADNGNGFDVNQAQQKGNGLNNMVVRARQHGGDCLISSAIGKGTVVTVMWPLT